MKRLLGSMSLASLLLFTAGCLKLSPPQFVDVREIKIVQATKDSLTVLIVAHFRNPNRMGGTVYGIHYTILLDSSKAGEGEWRGAQRIEGKSDFDLPVPLSVGEKDWPTWRDALTEDDSVQVNIPCKVTLGNWLGRHDFTFNLKTKYLIKQIVTQWVRQELTKTQPRVESVAWSKAGPQSNTLEVTMSFQNPYRFELSVDSLDADILVNNIPVGTLRSLDRLAVAAGARSAVHYTVSLNTASAGSALLSGVLRMGWKCSIRGSAFISMSGTAVEIPISYEGKIL